MKCRIKELLTGSGADACGIVKARIFDEFAPALSEGKYPFCDKIGITPFDVMEDAESVIVFAVSYHSKRSGNVSSYAFGMDYHKVLPEIAKPAIDYLKENGFSAEFFTDNGSLPERHLAQLAGLGFVGKNHCLIHPKLGSFTFIGYILTNCPIDADAPLEMSCMDCGKCIDACPSGALKSRDFSKCLSYITQKKGELTESEAELIKSGGSIWGCDICQRVCPHNADAPEAVRQEFRIDLMPNVEIDRDITNREFREKYGEKAFSWRGKNVILRNQKLVKGR